MFRLRHCISIPPNHCRKNRNLFSPSRLRSTIALSLLVVPVGILSLPSSSHATLGEPAESIARDRQALSAVHKRTTVKASYTVQEEVSDATSVREFVNASGVVFAVAWNGRVHPDLTQLLGSYAPEFRAAKKSQPRDPGRRRLQIKTGNMIVETWGHMRNLQGRAYLPALLPEGVTSDEIK